MSIDQLHSGVDVDAFDRSVRPQDDLFGFVNGGWAARTEIPADRGRFGTFDVLRDTAQEHMREIVDRAAEVATEGGRGDELASVRSQVGALYASFMDVEQVEAAGVSPLVDVVLGVIEAADAQQLWGRLGALQREGVAGAVAVFVDTDRRSSDSYVTNMYQSGLGLPDEAYYRDEDHAEVREQYVKHIERTFALLAEHAPELVAPLGAADEIARAVMAHETVLASYHWDRVAARDAVATYNKVSFDGLMELAPAVPWRAWLDGAGAPEGGPAEFVVAMPSYVQGLSELVQSAELLEWKRWAVWSVLRSWSSYLPGAFDQEHFDFYGRVLTGTTVQRDRWRRGVALVDGLIGEAAGRLYVAERFKPESKARVQELVSNLIEAYRRDISDLDWMSEATKARALEKLSLFTPKIGYPDSWRDYSGLRVEADDLIGNVRRAMAFETDREWRKLGGPVDRGEWFMTPQTVNAYYNPGMNEIVFPAAILQPPFFDPEADDAVNYGAIGSVIGHEIGHGFDDQGSKYDGRGNLEDWWTEEDRERFDERATALIAQYEGLRTRDLPEEKVNGALTVGENIGDLGGVTISYLAYLISLDGAEPALLDGLTGQQRFFVGWAQAWRGKSRPQEARRLLKIDPHSPVDLRANIVRNLTEFHEAFEVAPGDGLWLAPSERVRIW
ncbi:M13 family metallopeptidase [Dermatophilus congolensis]|uniref:M13 family metallopeptidase n=1 Tax=Dermatophilus congolensis TaxID=1863 RepID=UPI001AAEA515|nr:M13-type metalloendopeptidase [Dermatophilus congolensis]MBO3142102.1 peptidase M13 [Dermatophilus congolensis]MBO3151094.1 peptidase M13 [Dermatophilus congolensis]MBO3161903.1 peptidase M13 [Dermatophilus congolensis]MBO3162377.1 peptidase M13 [Dermatophilus congolensis]MBO3175935.1 peptidase M13 [Dermatophilus congolensis]